MGKKVQASYVGVFIFWRKKNNLSRKDLKKKFIAKRFIPREKIPFRIFCASKMFENGLFKLWIDKKNGFLIDKSDHHTFSSIAVCIPAGWTRNIKWFFNKKVRKTHIKLIFKHVRFNIQHEKNLPSGLIFKKKFKTAM